MREASRHISPEARRYERVITQVIRDADDLSDPLLLAKHWTRKELLDAAARLERRLDTAIDAREWVMADGIEETLHRIYLAKQNYRTVRGLR